MKCGREQRQRAQRIEREGAEVTLDDGAGLVPARPAGREREDSE
jgi:hypothetical protein